MIPRWMHQLYAFLFGYFWLPCPLCQQYMGGHEWLPGHMIYDSWNTGHSVCHNCKERADALNAKFFKTHDLRIM